LGFFI